MAEALGTGTGTGNLWISSIQGLVGLLVRVHGAERLPHGAVALEPGPEGDLPGAVALLDPPLWRARTRASCWTCCRSGPAELVVVDGHGGERGRGAAADDEDAHVLGPHARLGEQLVQRAGHGRVGRDVEHRLEAGVVHILIV
jgi:hypothetical protein